MTKVKCELIPLDEFYHIPPIAFQDEVWSYFKHTTTTGKEHLSRKKRKNCSYCGSAAVWVGVSSFKDTKELNHCAKNMLPSSLILLMKLHNKMKFHKLNQNLQF